MNTEFIKPASSHPATALRYNRRDLDARWGHASSDGLTGAVLVYLLAPGWLFAVTWMQSGPGLATAIAGLAALLVSRTGRGWPERLPVTCLCLALGMAWAGMTGAHHLVYSTADWEIRDAVLRDLSLDPWPVGYAEAGHSRTWLLRAPLGFFLPAGLIGRAMGFGAAQVALWAWAGLGFALVLMLLRTLARALDQARPGRAFAVMAFTFFLFGGLDLLPNLWLDTAAGAGPFASWGRGGEWWDRLFQYTGHVTATLWVPNHALPAWLVALLVVRHGATAGFRLWAAVPIAGSLFWSPIAAAGAAVLGLAALASRGWRSILGACVAPANILAALSAFPIALYIVAGAAGVPHGLLLTEHPAPEALSRWLLLLMVEVLCWAGLASVLVRYSIATTATVLLCLLPFYVFGPGNEMTSRGGLAPVAVLAVVVAAALITRTATLPQAAAKVGLLACAAIAAGGSLMEGSLLVTGRPWPASRQCSLPEAASQSVFRDSTDWSHYLVSWPFLGGRHLIREPSLRPVAPSGVSSACWPGGGP
ncbi:MAG: hypothetical protein JWR00_3706 [Rubritepida sp.]|nr:hypothetical protein [Rubritepida sp.]